MAPECDLIEPDIETSSLALDGEPHNVPAQPSPRRDRKRGTRFERKVLRVQAAGEPKVVHDNWSIDRRWSLGLEWPVVVWIGIVHAGALAAPFFFSWSGLAIACALYWLTGPIGVCLGYHRQLTHKSFTTYRPVRWLLAFVGGLSGEGSAITWVANHRKHHAHSDTDHDPHSPRHGGLWSHMLWFSPNFGSAYSKQLIAAYASDLAADGVLRWLDRLFIPIQIAFGLGLFALGYALGGAYLAWSFVVYGMFVRMVAVFHVTWFVNSATHMWGYRNYETTDDSRNLWWVGLLAAGEGWHNNHHAFQRMARHGHKWWEIDMTYMTICLMEKVGLAWDVVHDVAARRRYAETT